MRGKIEEIDHKTVALNYLKRRGVSKFVPGGESETSCTDKESYGN